MKILGDQSIREEKAYPIGVYPNIEMNFQFKITKKFKNDYGLVKSPVTFAEMRKQPQHLTATLSKSTMSYANLALVLSSAKFILEI